MKKNLSFFAFLLCILIYFVGDAVSETEKERCLRNAIGPKFFASLFEPIREETLDDRFVVVTTILSRYYNASSAYLKSVNKCYPNESITETELRLCVKEAIKDSPGQHLQQFDEIYMDDTLQDRALILREIEKRGATKDQLINVDDCYSSLALVLGCVFGIIFLIILLLGIIGCCVRKRRN